MDSRGATGRWHRRRTIISVWVHGYNTARLMHRLNRYPRSYVTRCARNLDRSSSRTSWTAMVFVAVVSSFSYKKM